MNLYVAYHIFYVFQVTISKPYFYFNNNKIYNTFDIPHIFKNIRTALFKYKISTDFGTVDGNVIKELYYLDKQSNSRLCPKLTDRHIYLSSADKMKVSLATQVLSNSVAIGILILAKVGNFNKQNMGNWYATFMFVLNMNKAFDAMNSSKINHKNQMKKALSLNNEPFEFLKTEFLPYLNTLKVMTKNKLYCFDGLNQSINAALQMCEDKSEDINHVEKFVQTRKINSDPLENFFATVRGRNGFNNEPSVYEFGSTLARISSQKIRGSTSQSQNCEPSHITNIKELAGSSLKDYKTNLKKKEFEINEFDNLDLESVPFASELRDKDEQVEESEENNLIRFVDDHFEDESESYEEEHEVTDFARLSTISEMKETYKEKEQELVLKSELLIEKIPSSFSDKIALRYITGYAINKYYMKTKCHRISDLIKNEELTLDSELLLKLKSRYHSFGESNFCNPCESFFEVMNFNFQIYNICFKNILFIRNVNNVIMDLCIKNSNVKYNNYFLENEECDCINGNHKKEILSYIIRILLRRNCAWKKYEIKASTKKYSHLKKYNN